MTALEQALTKEAPTNETDEPLLSVRGLGVSFRRGRDRLRAVHDVSFDVYRGKTLGLVGESGCGKSVTSLSLLRLLPEEAVVDSGRVMWRGRDLLSLPERELRRVRGSQIAVVFQDPMTSLNPVYTVGWQIVEAIRIHESVSRRAARERAIGLLRSVGIADPASRVDAYPHELSGGMRQRALLAMALACGPDLLIADEPTTALDVTVQAQILELLRGFQKERGMGMVLVSHDLGVVARYVDEVAVMYAGRVVERCPAGSLFEGTRHPYTRGLLASLPPEGASWYRGAAGRPARLPTLEGSVPGPGDVLPGCRFEPRCPKRQPPCREGEPAPIEVAPGHEARCLYANEAGR
jgi:peptide/nickel transport system ATP-binding protein